ncbi:MAG: peptidase MA domain-containing protein [Chloroflexi bacterium]|nr:peptidase MA domain-containing protein [Chloroflexota bacterium]
MKGLRPFKLPLDKLISKDVKRAVLFILTVFLFLSAATACVPTGKPLDVAQDKTAAPVEAPPAKPAEPAKPAATGQFNVLNSSVIPDFPGKLLFNLKAENGANITDIRLHYTVVDREAFARVASEVFIEFTPGASIDVQWPWDMRKTGGLPTGAIIEYWWTLKDARGNQTETTPAKINFDDKRYAWQSITENNVTLYWYKGNQSFADELMASVQQALVRLADNTGAHLKKPVKLYIYANSRDVQGAMIFPQEWTGGAAFTEFGIIFLGIDSSNLEWGKGAIAHELSHLVVHQMTFNPYIEPPPWLDEGLATYNQGALDATFVGALKAAMSSNSLSSTRSLSSPFSAFPAQSYLAYAQSYSLVEYLLTTYGQSKMLELLTVFSEGSSYDGALKKVYGFDMDGLDTAWRSYVARRYPLTKGIIRPLPLALIRNSIEPAGITLDRLARVRAERRS